MKKQMMTHSWCLVIVLGGMVSFCFAQTAKKQAATDPIKALHDKMDSGLRGVLLAGFLDRSPDSSLASMITRIKFRSTAAPAIYDIEDETFVLYVPKDYNPREKFGLMVYISNIPAFVPPPDWIKTLEEHKMILISANNADKAQPPYRRMGLALDAVYNMTLRYTIDSDRIFIAGMHSGAELASVLAIHYPQTFAGGLFIHGCLYHRQIPAYKEGDIVVDEGFRRPMMDKLYRAKTDNRYVLLAGEKSSDLPTIKAIHERGFLEDRFKQVQLLVMPDTTTTRPDGVWLGKAIDALEPVAVTEPTP